MALDRQRVPAEFFGFGIADRESPLVLLCNVDRLDRLRGAPAVGVDHLVRLRAERLRQQCRPARDEIGLVEIELVRVDGTLHDGLTQPVGRVDEHHLIETRFGIERKHHAGCARVAADHALHAG